MIAKAQALEPRPRTWTREEYHRLGDLGFFQGQKVELLAGEIWIQYPADHKEPGLPYPSDEPHPRLWTKAEYYRLGELGFFANQRAELIGGEIVVLSPQKWPHGSTADRATEVLRNALGSGFWVRMQLPLDLGLVIEPEPDVSVVRGRREDYTAHPTTAVLVVEVSDTTLVYDQTVKTSLYAAGGMADYWIINLVQLQLEVYRQPIPDPTEPHGYRYADVAIYSRGQTISPLAAPSLVIAVADLVP
jgi:Uma2 family endonuclease